MESSAVVAFRALVMLSCLVLVPLAAILGSSFPDVVKTEVDRAVTWVKTISTGKVKSKKTRRPSATDSARRQSTDTRGSDLGDSNRKQGNGAKRADFTMPLPENRDTTGRVVPASSAQPAVAFPSGSQRDASEPQRLRPLPPPTNGDCADFSALETELRQRGAVYYLLESWGEHPQQYRFHCRVALSHNATSVKQFEAVDENPLTAMKKVVEQVKAYRAGRE